MNFGEATLEIDLNSLSDNWRQIKALTQPAITAGVVKANAYGLGLSPVADILWRSGCRDFFVAHPTEGLHLRDLLPDATIYILHGTPEQSAKTLIEARLIPLLNTPAQIARYVAFFQGKPLAAAIQLDTGMSRLGLSELETMALVKSADLAKLDLKLVVSHLACADTAEHPLNQYQLERFETLRHMLPAAPASLANSAGCFLDSKYHFDLVRPGIALYGGKPTSAEHNPMRQVIKLTAKILQVREIDTPRTVGYGATHSLPAGSRLATVGIGYADGYPRALSNVGFASIGGTLVPVVGRVSMDLITLDISTLPKTQAGEGSDVTLLGGNVPLDNLAERAGTIDYELLTRLGARYRRIYRGL